jgi:hypothetical protein
MSDDKVESEVEYPQLPSGPGAELSGIENGETPIRDAAVGLALYSAGTAWNKVNSAYRFSRSVGEFFFSPVKRVINGSAFEPARRQFEEFVVRGESEVDEWIQTGLAHESRTREVAKGAMDHVVERVVSYLSTNPSVEKLVKDQIELLAKESPELPQINILVRVLADNYITYLNENPDQVKQLIRSQGDEYIDHLMENPKPVQELVQGQSVSMVSEITDQVRERLVTVDSTLEVLARALFRRRPRSELPPPPVEVQARANQARNPEDYPRLTAFQNDQQ